MKIFITVQKIILILLRKQPQPFTTKFITVPESNRNRIQKNS